jgi:hypothetical protein
MAHVLLVATDGKLKPPFVKMLVAGGHLVGMTCEWSDAVQRAGEDFDAVVVDFAGDVAEPGVAALLNQLRARRAVPVLAMTGGNDIRKLRSRVLAPGIRVISRMSLLEELTALERKPSTDTFRRPTTDAWKRAAAMRTPRPATSTATATTPSTRAARDETTTADGSVLDEFRASDELLAVGATLDKYRIELLVGKGGFAHVYRAQHLVLGMPVALKVLKRSLAATEPQVLESFCAEARNAIRISHPNVVRVHDVNRGPKITYLVMEWIDGTSLSDVLSSTGRLPATDALRIGIAVCDGLEAALAHGTIHRDVKPGNILLADDGLVKLVDFGLAKNLRQSSLPSGGTSDASRIVGTPSYMAPEQAFAPETVDCRADMYALGATLFHALTGTLPFRGEDAVQLLLKHRDDPVPDVSQFAPDCPEELAGLVTRMMAKEPGKRFAAYAELRGHMQSLLDGLIEDGAERTNGWSTVYVRKGAQTKAL